MVDNNHNPISTQGDSKVDSNKSLPKKKKRILWIDNGKAIAMVFVFFSHMVEALSHKGYKYGVLESRFIGCFCIQYFFFLSGLVVKDQLPPFKEHVKKYFNALMIPFYYFNFLSLILFLCISIFYQGPLIRDVSTEPHIRFGVLFLGGLPSFNGATWFLTTLFTIQIIYFFVVGYTKKTKGLLLTMLSFSIVGYLISFPLENPSQLMKVVKYFWYVPTALTAIVFFMTGMLVSRLGLFDYFANNKKAAWAGFIITTILMFLTFNVNQSAYKGFWQAQHVNNLNYGNYFLYYSTTCLGLMFASFMSMVVKPNKLLTLYGQNTLPLVGLAGIIQFYVNPSIFHFIIKFGGDMSRLNFNLMMGGITVVEMLLCYPLFSVINKSIDFFKNKAEKIENWLGSALKPN